MNSFRRPTGWLSQLTLTDDSGEAVGGVIDHRLTRRALINEFRRGRIRREQLCDAHPDLVRAAKNFGDADNGVGIIPDQIKRLFQVFQRLQTLDTYEGAGVGLALCRRIVEHHNGRIWAESAGEGLGSKFCVALPVLKEVT